MSLTNYQQLQQSPTTPSTLGVALPVLVEQGMRLTTEHVSADVLAHYITTFSPTQGWVCYRDQVVISAETPTRVDILEAEYCNASASLMIKHLSGSQYKVVQCNAVEVDSAFPTVYRNHVLLLRSAFHHKATKVHYRVWYQQYTDGEQCAKWRATAQQFMGFC